MNIQCHKCRKRCYLHPSLAFSRHPTYDKLSSPPPFTLDGHNAAHAYDRKEILEFFVCTHKNTLQPRSRWTFSRPYTDSNTNKQNISTQFNCLTCYSLYEKSRQMENCPIWCSGFCFLSWLCTLSTNAFGTLWPNSQAHFSPLEQICGKHTSFGPSNSPIISRSCTRNTAP